jgi:hypothetical protein
VVAVAATVIPLALNQAPAFSDTTKIPAIIRDAYRPPPKKWLVAGEILFNRLKESQLAKVRITPDLAVRLATAQYGRAPHSYVVFESLGGYVDTNRIVHDWVGTTSWVPKALPAYLVRIGGADIPSLGPGTQHENHFWNVIVDAVSGKVVVAFSFN